MTVRKHVRQPTPQRATLTFEGMTFYLTCDRILTTVTGYPAQRLTPTEYQLFQVLVHAKPPVSIERLTGHSTDSRLKHHISRLRAKLNVFDLDIGWQSGYIMGYRLQCING